MSDSLAGPSSFLLFSQKIFINRLELDVNESPDIVLPIHGLKNIRALEFDPTSNFVYWVDGKAHTIRRCRDNGTKVRLTFCIFPLLPQ